QMRIAAPRQRVSQRRKVAIRAEVRRQVRSHALFNRTRCRPLDLLVFSQTDPRHAVAPHSEKRTVALPVPATRLPAIEGLRKHVGAERGGPGERPPIRPRRNYFAGFSHRKLFCSANTCPSAPTSAIFHATGSAF